MSCPHGKLDGCAVCEEIASLKDDLAIQKKITEITARQRDTLAARVDSATAALSAINEIRNSIVGLQKVNWSEHVYPLVAALNSAGIEGMPYDEARGKFGTMLERTVKAESDRDEALEALRELYEAETAEHTFGSIGTQVAFRRSAARDRARAILEAKP